MSSSNFKLLLTGVFGPFGIKDEWAEGLGMQMELLNNQITREQNIHSIRQHYLTLPLYLLAENVKVPSVVLDFPTWDDFIHELEQDYTHIGINFIVPNVLKVKRMTEYIRKNYPQMKIILGGYGTIIPHLDQILPYDAICQGEGVTWLREYFGEDPNSPIIHPILQNPISQSVYGFKMMPNSSVVMPGLGCKNGCEFCITSHKFGKKYIPLLPTGKDIFNECEKIYKTMGATEFFIMDENFLKQPQRAKDLLTEMELHQRPFTFELFSSAEIIHELGVDFLVRFGAKMIWIGVESPSFAHSKIQGFDIKHLVQDLQAHGISVNTSAILFLDNHTETTIQNDIDWTINLGADMTQFMNYTPYPTTTLYERLQKEGRLNNLEYRYQTGQGPLNWIHPHIPDPAKQIKYTRDAFKKKFEENGPSVLNMAITAIQGYISAIHEYELRKTQGLHWNSVTSKYELIPSAENDSFFVKRLEILKNAAMEMRPILIVNKILATSSKIKEKVAHAQKLYDSVFGALSLIDTIKSYALIVPAIAALAEHSMNTIIGNETVVIQPPKIRAEYRLKKDLLLLPDKTIVGQTSIVEVIKDKVRDTLRSVNPKRKILSPVWQFQYYVKDGLTRTKRILDYSIAQVGNTMYYKLK